MYYQVLPDEAIVVYPNQARRNSFANNHLEIRMFHVGQGECILVIFPNKNCWLIDCSKGTAMATYLRNSGLHLNTIIPTHPHADHGRGFKTILADP